LEHLHASYPHRIQDGYASFEAGDEDRAGAIWLDAWGDLLRRHPPHVGAISEATAACPGLQSVETWDQQLCGRALDRAERGLAWVRSLCERCTGAESMLVEQEALFLEMLGRREEAEDPAAAIGARGGDPASGP
jgi:hypothetical protein